MITEEFEGKTTQEIETLLQSKLEEYTKQVNDTTDLVVLKKMELDIDAQQAEYDEYLRKAEYDIQTEPVEFEGKKYTPSEIAKKIIYYLNKNEQTFEYCLGLHGLVTLWKANDIKKISYGAYDSTLRLLGQVKFKGDSEWVDILVINNYLSSAHEGYIKDRAGLLYLAEIRNRVVSRIQLCTKPSDEQAEAKEA